MHKNITRLALDYLQSVFAYANEYMNIIFMRQGLCVCVCGHYRSGILATPLFLQSAPSTAARSLNVVSTHCEIAIKDVINK